VRAAAAAVLGSLCDEDSVDRLTRLAQALADPNASEDAQRVALGALSGIAALRPVDLRARLAPLLAPSAPPSTRAAAGSALSAASSCH
jgi:hypothetical protein